MRNNGNNNYQNSENELYGSYNDRMPEEEKYQSQDLPIKEGSEPEPQMTEEEKFFKDFTHEDIDSKDPSLGDKLMKIYEEEVPFEIRNDDENLSEKEQSKFKSLICKVLTTDEMSEQINIKIELASDEDLFFYYTTNVNEEIFEKTKEEQKLTCNFKDFSDLLIKYFDFCINDKKSFLAVLHIKSDKTASMEFFENLEYKSVELIHLIFTPASDDLIRKQISYRYNSMRAVQDITQNRIDIINGVLKDTDTQLIPEVKNEIISKLIKNKN